MNRTMRRMSLGMAIAALLSAVAMVSPAAAVPADSGSGTVDLRLPAPLGSFDKLALDGTRVTAPVRAQAGAAGLTSRQMTMLQAAVDYYVDATGGKQISYNTVAVDGAELVFPTPRADSRAAAPAAVRGCDNGYFCMWHAVAWGGGWPDGPDPDLRLYYCTKTAISGWVGNGSYINNQTKGTVAVFYGRNGTTEVGRSKAAYASDGEYYWTPVWYVDPC